MMLKNYLKKSKCHPCLQSFCSCLVCDSQNGQPALKRSPVTPMDLTTQFFFLFLILSGERGNKRLADKQLRRLK